MTTGKNKKSTVNLENAVIWLFTWQPANDIIPKFSQTVFQKY